MCASYEARLNVRQLVRVFTETRIAPGGQRLFAQLAGEAVEVQPTDQGLV